MHFIINQCTLTANF